MGVAQSGIFSTRDIKLVKFGLGISSFESEWAGKRPKKGPSNKVVRAQKKFVLAHENPNDNMGHLKLLILERLEE